MKKYYLFSLIIFILFLSACSLKIDKDDNNSVNLAIQSEKIVDSSNFSNVSAPLIVYKAKHDYSDKVSISLGDDGKIIAFPGPTDVVHQAPIKLENGYLIKKMLGNVFLSVTIDKFANSGDWMSYVDEKYIIDFDPFIEIYECNQVAKNEADLNKLILSDRLNECKKIDLTLKTPKAEIDMFNSL